MASIFPLLLPYSMQTKFCQTCQKVKNATPENFQRRGDGWRTPCKACMKQVSTHPKKPKELVKALMNSLDLELTHEATRQEPPKPTKVHIESDDIFTQLSLKFGRMLSIRIDRDLKTEISVYGVEHFERFRGKTPDEAIALALS